MMPWKEVTQMKQRYEFIQLAMKGDANIASLCKRHGVSRKTAYKWLKRYESEGELGLENRSRRPRNTPSKTSEELEKLVVDLRREHPAWGARKLVARLKKQGHADVPPPSTVTRILHRHDLVSEQASEQAKHWNRFEHASPNDLWQMDFKGHFALREGRCHPLTVLDDHSRFSVVLKACLNEQMKTVQVALIETFRRYGLPCRINVDNGSPWGHSCGDPGGRSYTALVVWLIRLGIRVSYSSPYHPQTNGKEERFHRTLKAEVLKYQEFSTLVQAQEAFEKWRHCYNCERPHEAIGMGVPIDRYQASQSLYPEVLAPIEYAPGDIVRKVQSRGEIHYKGKCFQIGQAFHGQAVALRQTMDEHLLDVYFCNQKITVCDLKTHLN